MPNDATNTSDENGPDKRRGSVGAGAESAAGLHGATDRSASDPAGDDRPGSEPLERDREHKPSYGGEGGKPRTSSDTREPVDPDGG